MYRFICHVNEARGSHFTDYDELYDWSTSNIPDFWASFWDFANIITSRRFNSVVDDPASMPGARWFEGARMNFAENLLRYRDDTTAIIFKSECQKSRRTTYAELYHSVARTAKALRKAGVRSGDRVVGFMPNMTETVVAMLAATSIGAVWSSCSPDFGTKGTLDRFGQITPKILFTTDGYFYNGKSIDQLDRVREIAATITSIELVVVVPYIAENPDITGVPRSISWDMFNMPASDVENPVFNQLPADHPLYIMYSSGTTGLPKCLVQSAGGVLVNQLKELILHTDLRRSDTIFYFTTCGWMMWNWLVCSLAVGATIVLYDGSPFHPNPGTLWKLAEEEKITVFGTSARYLSALEKEGIRPGREYNLASLRAVLSTGSPLPPEGFDYVYRDIKRDLQLSSISGGTDINGCFALGNPMGAVYRGELQCRGLGMKVKAYDAEGRPVTGRTGELVCEAASPSMPIYFWNDEDGTKYRNSYFTVYPGIWRHGDFITVTDTGGMIIHGRSDATLNPGGVRIGTAEIYRQIEGFEEILDCLVVGQSYKNDVRVVLFVKMKENLELTDDLKNKIKRRIRENTTPRHVPGLIIQIGDIPYTINMKKVELAVKNIIEGKEALNREALANPESLELYKNIPELGT